MEEKLTVTTKPPSVKLWLKKDAKLKREKN